MTDLMLKKYVCMMQVAPEKKSEPQKSQQAAVSSAAAGSADSIEQRQKDARKWINDWRARWADYCSGSNSPHKTNLLEPLRG